MSEFEQISMFDLEEGSGDFYKAPDDPAAAAKQAETLHGLRRSDLRAILTDAGRIAPVQATPAPAVRAQKTLTRDYSKLVIVEHSAFHRNTLKHLLERESCQVAGAVDYALKANAIFEQTDAGAAVIDLDDREEINAEVVDIIRRKFSDVIIICASDRRSPADLESAGIRSVVLLEKPYTESSVRRALGQLASKIHESRIQ